MVVASHSRFSARGPTARVLGHRWSRVVRQFREAEIFWVTVLLALTASLGVAIVRSNGEVPLSAVVVPMVIANVVLTPRRIPWLVLVTLSVLVVDVAASPPLLDESIGQIVVVFAVGVIILMSSFRRAGLGVAGLRGDSMLVDLRERLTKQCQIPTLPDHWTAEVVLRSAGGSAFAGDFVVASRSADDSRLEVAVVDVSGKGEQAGTRSLQLSGAFGGLLGALPPDQFLPAANDYLLSQEWSEGFASAVHLSLDLSSGDFELRSAGHPPAVQLSSGSGRWLVQHSEGPVLGLIRSATFGCVDGRLDFGDALLLYTDGLVETPTRDISSGIDKLVGRCEQVLRFGFDGGAQRIVDALESGDDDQALLLLHRR